jgi:eukaryotic-like serine/threonine-protein kinase
MSIGAKRVDRPPSGLTLPRRYTVRRHIATGGMASVWCAQDRVLRREVAIKVLSERFAYDELAIRRFKREARAAARVSAHPHVVTIFDVGDIEPQRGEPCPRAFLVMEYLAGGNVADALRSHSVSRADARRWLREAASALDHAHERGVIHRDIKPANFLLDRNRGLHVADFGIARLQSEDTITSSGELFGTAAYLAPEQTLGREATSASDRYSLAVAAFELITGSRPFTAPHFTAQARQHIEEEPPKASRLDRTIPPAADDVLRRGMAKEPEARYPTAGTFVEALARALDEATTAPTRPLAAGAPIAAPPARAAPRKPTPVAAKTAAARTRPAGAARTAVPAPLRAANSGHRHRSGRLVALSALALAALGVILLITQLGGSSTKPAAQGSASHPKSSPVRHHHHHHAAAVNSSSTSASSTTPTVASSSTAAPAVASSSTAAPAAAAPSAAALQLQGHNEMLAGNYSEAIPTLRRALGAAAPASLTYAYALYDLGRSLLLSGDPQAAIPVLEQRLKIPNQTAVVQATLDQALRAAGQAPTQSSATGGAATGRPPHDQGSGHGGGHGNRKGKGGKGEG